jgi:hypothetical protein
MGNENIDLAHLDTSVATVADLRIEGKRFQNGFFCADEIFFALHDLCSS